MSPYPRALPNICSHLLLGLTALFCVSALAKLPAGFEPPLEAPEFASERALAEALPTLKRDSSIAVVLVLSKDEGAGQKFRQRVDAKDVLKREGLESVSYREIELQSFDQLNDPNAAPDDLARAWRTMLASDRNDRLPKFLIVVDGRLVASKFGLMSWSDWILPWLKSLVAARARATP